jgi:PKD repeat protein
MKMIKLLRERLVVLLLLALFTGESIAQGLPEMMYFKFDGTGTTVLNEAANPVMPSGTLFGGMNQGGNAQFNGGLIGNGDLSNNSHFTTGWRTNLSGSWTISLYVQNIQNQGFNQVYLFGNSSNTGPNIRMFTNSFTLNSVTFAVAGVTGWSNISMPMTVGATFVVHIVHDAAAQQIRLYRDGALVTTAAAPAGMSILANAGTELLIGGHIQSATVGRNINTGTLIDEFRMYNRALAASEIALTWNQQLPLAAACPFSSNFTVVPDGVTALVNWTPGAGNTNYHFEYGPSGFNPGTGTMLSGVLGGAVPPLNVSGLAPQTTYDWYFYERCNSGTDTGFVSSGSFTTLVACPAPTNFAFNPPGGSEIGFSWSSVGNSFDIEYGPGGFSQGLGTTISSTSTSATISGLTPNTTYDVYVRRNCSAASLGNSTWIGPFTITTTCNVVGLPYVQDFDSPSWVVGTLAAHGGSQIDNCWDRSPATGYFWGPKSLPTVTRNSGPNRAFNGDNYVFAVANNGTSGAQAGLISPQLNLVGTTTPVLRFYFHMFGSQMGQLVTQVNNGSGWVSMDTISGQQQTTEFDPWRLREVSLSSFIGDTIRVRLLAIRGPGANSDIAVDAFSVRDEGTCPSPSEVRAIGHQFGQFTVGWNPTVAGTYEVQWGPSTFFQGTGINLTTTTDTFLVVPNPAYGCYLFQVRSICPGTGGAFTRLFEICLECLYNAPYIETFESDQWISGSFFNNNGSQIDSCWSRTPIWQGANIFFWGTRSGQTSTGNTGPNGDNTLNGNGKYVFAVGFGTGGDEAYLISPYIDLSTLNRPAIRYFYHLAGGQIGSVRTEVQRIGETTWTPMDVIVGAQQTGTNDPWLPRNVPIYDYAGDTIRVRMAAVRGAGAFNTGDHALDDFEIFEDLSCTTPGLPAASAITDTSAQISWVSNGLTDFRVLYSEAPFNPATANSVNVTGDSVVLSGLNAESSYVVYVLAVCDSLNISDTSQVLLFNTGCPSVFVAPYIQGFENNKWIPGTGAANANSVISACWSRTANNTNYRFGTRTGETQSTLFPFTGPLGAFAGDKYIVARNSNINTVIGDQTTFVTPQIDVSGLTVPAVSYYYHMHGANMGSLLVQVNDGSGWRTIDSLSGAQQFAQSDPWLHRLIPMTGLSSDTIQVRFFATLGGQYADIAIDEVGIVEGPPCTPPNQITVQVVGPDSVVVAFNPINPVTMELAYGPQNFLPSSTAGTVVTPITNPFGLGGLTPGFCYSVYVRNNCTSNGDSVSAWIGPVNFCTPIDFDLAASVLLAPGATCGDSAQQISLVVTNNGFNPESGFDLGATFSQGGTLLSTLATTFSGTLQPGQTDTIPLGTINTAGGGNFFLRAFTNLVNDANRFNDTISRLLFTVDLNPVAITLNPDTICVLGTSMLIKNPAFAAEIGWYDLINNLLATGDTFTTPNLSRDSTFVARGLVTTGQVGPLNNAFGNNTGFFTVFDSAALAFTANRWMTIDSVTIYPNGPGIVNVVLRTNPGDSVVNNRFITVPASFTGGAFRAALGMPVIPGNYHLGVDTNGTTVTGLGRTSTNTQYPYSFGQDVIITGNNMGEPSIYYFFYNWAITVGDICGRPDAQITVPVRDVPVANINVVSSGATGTTYDVQFDASASTGGTQFIWDFGDGNQGSGMNPAHSYVTNGTYTVTLIVRNACSADTATFTITAAGIGLTIFEGASIRLYPNPTRGDWQLEGLGLPMGPYLIEVVHASGQLVFREAFDLHQRDLNRGFNSTSWAPGAYTVRLASGDQVVHLRLLVL